MSEMFSEPNNQSSQVVGSLNNGTGNENLFQASMKFMFGGVLLILVGSLGIIGNGIAIIIFSRVRKQLSFHRLMIMLALYDTLFIMLSLVLFAVPAVNENYVKSGSHYLVAPKALPLIQIALTGSIYSTVAITIERYLIVCHPFYVISHEWSFKRYSLPIVSFSIIYNIPRFFELRSKRCCFGEGSNTTVVFNNQFGQSCDINFNSTSVIMTESSMETCAYDYTPTEMRVNGYYIWIYYIGLNFLTMGLFPYLLLSILNILTLKGLKSLIVETRERFTVVDNRERLKELTANTNDGFQQERRQNRKFNKNRINTNEIRLAKVSLAMVLIFIICHSVKWIPNICELISRIKNDGKLMPIPWVFSIEPLSHFLAVFNSSINFFIYCLMHSHIIKKSIIRRSSGKKKRTILLNRLQAE